jgi:hypothetical protein
MKRNTFWRVVIASSAFLALSCDSSQVTGPSANEASNAPPQSPTNLLWWNDPDPIWCPSQTSSSTTAEIGLLGGLLSVGGVSVSIPAGALLAPVTMTLSLPASNHLEIDISVEGSEHFIFELPVVVTVSYARCGWQGWSPISAWYFNQGTGELLEQMPSLDNKLLRTVTFTTGHLSGYILAN